MGGDRVYREPDYRTTAGEFIRHVASQWGPRDLAVINDRRLTFADAEAQSAQIGRAHV